MSIDFSRIPTANYRGAYHIHPLPYIAPTGNKYTMVELFDSWVNYKTVFQVTDFVVGLKINLQNIPGYVHSPIAAIRGVYIDNVRDWTTAPNSPRKSFLADDTSIFVSGANNSIVFAPFFTNTLTITLYAFASSKITDFTDEWVVALTDYPFAPVTFSGPSA